MSRYFAKRASRSFWVEDEVYVDPSTHLPSVSDHEAVNTGLLDLNGDPIMRAPNPIGFGRDEDW